MNAFPNGRMAASAVILRGAALVVLFASLFQRMRGQANAMPPETMAYQAVVTDGSGVLLGNAQATNITVIFRIYDSATGGNLLWSESQAISVNKGRVNVLLGEGTPYATEAKPKLSEVFISASTASTAGERHVETTVRGLGAGGVDLTLSPRIRLLATPYAILSAHARTAGRLVNAAQANQVVQSGTNVVVNGATPTERLSVGGTVTGRSLEVQGDARFGVMSGSVLNGMGIPPVGSVIIWSGVTPPPGWALCTGSVTNGIATPDLRGRFVMGAGFVAGAGLSLRVPGAAGGEEGHVMQAHEMPLHTHQATAPTVTTTEAGAHPHGYIFQGGAIAAYPGGQEWQGMNLFLKKLQTEVSGIHGHTYRMPGLWTTSTGQQSPINNMPPYYVLAFIIRVR